MLGARQDPSGGRRFRVALALVAVFTSCGIDFSPGTDDPGGGGGPPRCDTCQGEDGGPPAPPGIQGSVVARLRTSAFNTYPFVLRGTLPVPPHTFPRPDGKDPFVVLDWDGSPALTQTEIVSRYANPAEGADVVEILATVGRDPGLAVGTLLDYDVVLAPHAAPADPGTVDLRDLGATQPLTSETLALLADPAAIEIRAYDCFGNLYVSRPLDGTGGFKLMRHGPVQTELRVYQVMRPEPFVGGAAGTLPHLLGVHAYLSTFSGQNVIGLDLRFNNGHSGRDTTSNLDDPLGKVYFERIEVTMPGNWTMQQSLRDPFLEGPNVVGNRNTWQLVKPTGSGAMHVMRWQGQFHRRLMLSQGSDWYKADDAMRGGGHAFALRGVNSATGRENWSWWNRGTSRYFPQRYQLPSMDHVGLGNIRNQLAAARNELRTHMENGSGTGTYPYVSGVLGWGHPYGVSYGGMTSGSEIVCSDGISVAASASVPGYMLYAGTHRMHTDRQPSALYDLDGEPSSVERWLVPNGGQPYVPFFCYLTPFLGGSYPDPFGYFAAPTFQRDFVQASGLQPGYEAAHLAYDPHDLQHLIRYTRSAKVLTWLGNDSIAKDDLRMQAEDFHLSFHPYRNGSFGGAQDSGMRAMQQFVGQFPGKGCGFGRGEAWGLDCALAYYSVADPAWREAKRPWLEQVAEMLLTGQAQCSGFIQAFVSNKAVDGRYRARQQIEQSITENTLQGLRETVFRRRDAGHSDMIRDVLVDSLYGFIGPMAWFPGENGPWRYTGIGPLDVHLPVWCSRSQMPGDSWTAGDTETYQDWSSFAYAFELTGDPVFLDYAMIQTGGFDLYTSLLNEGTDNIENMGALLALMQRRNGQL